MLTYEEFAKKQDIKNWSHTNSIIAEALETCKLNGINVDSKRFQKVYPFTTEYIANYIELFKLCNKSLLTVGSSSDQAINAAYYGCFDITVCDLCPFTKYYFNLKKAAIESLTYDEFIVFFSYEHYTTAYDEIEEKEYTISFNENIFNRKSFEKLKKNLRLIDYESYLFWDNLFQNHKGTSIYDGLLKFEENKFEIAKLYSPYYKDEKAYNNTRQIISYVNPTFISKNILDYKDEKKFDNIFLSNIAAYLNYKDYLQIVTNMIRHLNDNGKILVDYIYNYDDKEKYKKNERNDVYNLKMIRKLLYRYNYQFKSFNNEREVYNISNNDSILIYKKKKK